MNYIEWVATILMVIGAIAVAHKKKWAFILYSISNVLWIVIMFKVSVFGMVALQIMFLGVNIYSWIKWAEE